ncbi:3-hydroxyacyl-CoA dehydrogenase NAD-binding domain-containing protein [Kerstersia gyiorum]|jgi:3-hydroxyacyl-CoA dehydrogenase|uniref:3-hydroxyacyl-CoA dehydrogenase NAD-binding domain-containing protein n=1 Tax=Kerstersia gyiorum TaxID=206506 RepID=UPI002431E049|nr:3-hydroxyacyl-CoA dehydrogenase NAD-binding domain-containing protein [Kerstersia gyiorum]MCH4271026.1 3-hydroxyacyl-CoA dehydrogenase NAD-binding domain-containing protein [Kerstersia gyiorum]MCI1230017.1 3-hydroxyacyl-CoA dehydrogenase NAD-binding domain-containing protein [Kerstersia gyiorum]
MSITIEREDGLAVVTVDFPPVNALSQALRSGLIAAAEELDADPGVQGVVLICAGRTFIAGADVSEFGKPPQEPHLPDVVARIENAAKPWLAAIHGSALGGGLEIALACRFRMALAGAQAGLPEVKLGLVPGAGGCVRLPRLIGAALAVEAVTRGAPLNTAKAQAAGLFDAVVEGDLRGEALAYLRAALQRPLPLPLLQREVAPADAGFWEQAQADLRKRAGREVAPGLALECVRRACEGSVQEAMAFERASFLERRASDQARALRHIFFAERGAARPPELNGVEARAVNHAAVVGGGTMGAGIVVALRDAGIPVILLERDDTALQRGLQRVADIYQSSVKRGRLSEGAAAERIGGVRGTTVDADLADVDLVIEAVFEDLQVKRDVFARLSQVCRNDAILATNTSYLDPALIAEGLVAPERFIGLHFFSPAQIMKLLEIVPIPQTAPDVLAAGFTLARRLGKIPVRAGICDGFIGNRILRTLRAQAERLLLAGATPQAVDAAMRAYGMPMGPFEAQDLGGLDIAAFQRKAARERGEAVFAPVADRLCEQGRLGQKTQAGWYDYAPGERRPLPSDTVAKVIAEAAAGVPQRAWSEAEIIDSIVLPMVNEAALILEEGIARRAVDVDLVEVHGYGFPRWRGGLLHDAEARGLKEVVARLRELAAAGLAPEPCRKLEQAAETGTF